MDRAGRALVRDTLDDAGVQTTVSHVQLLYPVPSYIRVFEEQTPRTRPLTFVQFIEVQAQHAFIRDESSKGRWDAALSRSLFGMMMEQFNRLVARDLGPKNAGSAKIEHVC